MTTLGYGMGEPNPLGPLAPLLADPAVTDVVVNAGETWVDRGEGMCRVAVDLGSPPRQRALAQRLATLCGRRLDDAQPYVDARLPNGDRLHAVLPPIAVNGVSIAIRTIRAKAFTLEELVGATVDDAELLELLRGIVRARLSYIVTGATGSGKTTLLATLLSEVPTSERLVVVEDTSELRPNHPHVVSLQTRSANVEGSGCVDMRELVRQALRMRPDRLVVGECRGAELIELLAALNTGHDGSAGTLHANSPADVVARLEALAALGAMTPTALHAQLRAALRCVIHIRRRPQGRAVAEIGVLDTSTSQLSVLPAWRSDCGETPGAHLLESMLRGRP